MNRVDTPPFYALSILVVWHDSYGGLRVNGRQQVVDMQGEVIPGLYAAAARRSAASTSTASARATCTGTSRHACRRGALRPGIAPSHGSEGRCVATFRRESRRGRSCAARHASRSLGHPGGHRAREALSPSGSGSPAPPNASPTAGGWRCATTTESNGRPQPSATTRGPGPTRSTTPRSLWSPLTSRVSIPGRPRR